MAVTFTKSASDIARYGGRIFIAPYDATKTTADTQIGFLTVAMSTGTGEDVVMESTKGFPASGSVIIGTETIPYTAKDVDGLTLTVTTRSAPAVHAVGSVVKFVSATAYTLQELGYFEKFSIESGKKDETVGYDCNGNKTYSFDEPSEPALKITGLQSDISTIALAFGKDTSAGTDGFTYISSTDAKNYLVYIYVKQQKNNSAGYRYGKVMAHNAVVSGSVTLDYSKEVQKLELNFKLIDGATEGVSYTIGQ